MDAQSKASCKAAAEGLTGKMDCVILNAGKMLGGKAATDPTDEGYGTMFAMHVLGRGPVPCNFAPVGSTRRSRAMWIDTLSKPAPSSSYPLGGSGVLIYIQ